MSLPLNPNQPAMESVSIAISGGGKKIERVIYVPPGMSLKLATMHLNEQIGLATKDAGVKEMLKGIGCK